MVIPQEIIDELMRRYKNPENLTGKNGLFKQLQKAFIELAESAKFWIKS